MKINIKVIDKVTALLKRVPRGAKGLIARVIGEYLLGNESRGLRHYAPWKRVKRKTVYGSSFFSNRQQRAFFAKLRSGEISVPFRRTGAQGKAWKLIGQSTNVSIVNNSKTVQFTRGQTALHAKMGWQTASATIKSNMKGALKAGKDALMKYIKSG
jgi:hypothetical protein